MKNFPSPPKFWQAGICSSIIAIVLFLFPLTVLAQPTHDSCTYKAYKECGKINQACSDSCPPLKGAGYAAGAACQDGCYEKAKNCNDEEYERCMKGEGAVPENKEPSPETNVSPAPEEKEQDQNLTTGGNSMRYLPMRALTTIGKTATTLIYGESALLDKPPSDNDLQPDSPPQEPSSEPLTGVVRKLNGPADMRLADGTWVELKVGDIIPAGAKAFTGFDVRMEVWISGIPIILDSLEEFSVEVFQTNPGAYRKELKLDNGALRFKVLETPIKTDMKVHTLNTTASIVGTDFGVSYDKDSGTSIWEIYDGSIEIESTSTGEKKTIATVYGSEIKRLTIGKDGSMIEKTVIPKSQANISLPIWIFIVGIGALAVVVFFFLKRKKAKSYRRK
ncbi:MAG: FecR domain-containing protein [Candidatus Levybacteria bacterium]|nr:FecR domain-containing protein [Candidatus Levybacteria bacterium]